MLINDDQFNERLNSEDNIANRFNKKVNTVVLHRPGRKSDVPNHSKEDKVDAVVLNRLGIKQETAAQLAGMSQGRVSQLNNDPKIEEDVQAKLKPVRDLAIEKMLKTIGLIDDEKLSSCKAESLSNIASNMSRIVEKTLPKESGNNGAQINLTIYAPEVRNERSYKTVEV